MVVVWISLLLLSGSLATGQHIYAAATEFGKANITLNEATINESFLGAEPNYESILSYGSSSPYYQIARPIGRLDMLVQTQSGRRFTSFCTASLISNDLIITNNHCRRH